MAPASVTAGGLPLAGACTAGGAPAAAEPPQPAVLTARAVRTIAAAVVTSTRCIEHPPGRYLGFAVTAKTERSVLTVPGPPSGRVSSEPARLLGPLTSDG